MKVLKTRKTSKKTFAGKDPKGECPRMDPERAICPAYDSTGIRKDLTPSREKMGVRVVDNACEEHMM
ncbi:MAG TPA: hypothetical protein H9679_01640 [Firmicutes bacterium]|nr:hypothetical protein [Bacillota bacterium]